MKLQPSLNKTFFSESFTPKYRHYGPMVTRPDVRDNEDYARWGPINFFKEEQ